MEKEVLLQKMREDNKKGDERFRQIETRCYANAFYAVNVLGCTVYLLKGLSNADPLLFRLMFGPVMLGLFVYYVSKFYFLKKKRYLFSMIFFSFGAIMFIETIMRLLFLRN